MAKLSFMLAFMIWFLATTAIQEFPISEGSASPNLLCKNDGDCANYNKCGPGRQPCKRYCFTGVCWCICGFCCGHENNVTQTIM
ncbi:unnamed protein product [Lupinus luteus]|uniref:Uncharacterized protein n=1 Tax=Lupinus luteus TaxID=3873 RepID=A0AAV1VZW1_LUPLU